MVQTPRSAFMYQKTSHLSVVVVVVVVVLAPRRNKPVNDVSVNVNRN